MLFCHFRSSSGLQRLERAIYCSPCRVTATAEASVVRFIDFHPTKTHLEGGNGYADKLLFSNCLRIVII